MRLTLNENLNVVSFYTINLSNAYNPKPTDDIVVIVGRDALL